MLSSSRCHGRGHREPQPSGRRRPARRPCAWAFRPRTEQLEDRRLLSTGGPPSLFEAPWRGYDTGTFPQFGPSSLAVADLDADGDLDAVVGRSYFGGPGVSVLRNQGDGTYGPPAHYNLPFNQSVGEVALADVDGDGKPDVLATVPDANGLSNKLALWRNQGDGTLAPRVEFVAGPGPVGLVVADFTGDGFPDVVTADYGYIAGDNNTISRCGTTGSRAPRPGSCPRSPSPRAAASRTASPPPTSTATGGPTWPWGGSPSTTRWATRSG
jgi:hypothetical protein